ncbi:MAG TPA: hypothetical protein IAB45_02665 [Candidatus Onthousia faecavium]|nr:hypothetical protein [Candidatus Onthousia faecavium]
MKKKEKKEKKKLTKKQLIILTIVTIILGIICYFLATEITKSIIDHRSVKEMLADDDVSDLQTLDTIEKINLETLISNYNDITDTAIDINDIDNDKINIDENINISFYLTDDNVYITTINFKKENNSTKDIIYDMIEANNKSLDNNTIDMIYEKVFETLGTTSDDNSETSEFFQYQGLEFSLKKYKDNDYIYSFRIGRIMNNENEE